VGGRVGGLAHERDGLAVPVWGRLRHAVGSGRRRLAALGEDVGGPVVGRQPPAVRGRRVDGAPDERVAEPEPPGRVRPADQVQAEELVERPRRLGLRPSGRGGRELGLERVPDHRGALEQPASA
jgi:hypothetical protein